MVCTCQGQCTDMAFFLSLVECLPPACVHPQGRLAMASFLSSGLLIEPMPIQARLLPVASFLWHGCGDLIGPAGWYGPFFLIRLSTQGNSFPFACLSRDSGMGPASPVPRSSGLHLFYTASYPEGHEHCCVCVAL